MRNNNNLNTKGATNVKSENEPPSNDWVDAKNAKVIRDESEWNAFQLMGDTNAQEMNHVAERGYAKSEKEMQKIMDRALAFRMGRKVKMIFEAQNARSS